MAVMLLSPSAPLAAPIHDAAKAGDVAGIAAALEALDSADADAGERLDVSLPGRTEPWGALLQEKTLAELTARHL